MSWSEPHPQPGCYIFSITFFKNFLLPFRYHLSFKRSAKVGAYFRTAKLVFQIVLKNFVKLLLQSTFHSRFLRLSPRFSFWERKDREGFRPAKCFPGKL